MADSKEYVNNKTSLCEKNNADDIIREAREEAEYIKAAAERDANKILATARTNALKKAEAIIAEAELRARRKGKEIISETAAEAQYIILSEAEGKILKYGEEIISEAEKIAQQIIEEAKRTAASPSFTANDDQQQRKTPHHRFKRIFRSS
ncbi:MAG: hypothetical protein JSV02_02595 [Dehalococcoidia bacterium]|nr:MAG: hypothetical protein JSV02_02595 [Dehalococcoidia bacterium]